MAPAAFMGGFTDPVAWLALLLPMSLMAGSWYEYDGILEDSPDVRSGKSSGFIQIKVASPIVIMKPGKQSGNSAISND